MVRWQNEPRAACPDTLHQIPTSPVIIHITKRARLIFRVSSHVYASLVVEWAGLAVHANLESGLSPVLHVGFQPTQNPETTNFQPGARRQGQSPVNPGPGAVVTTSMILTVRTIQYSIIGLVSPSPRAIC